MKHARKLASLLLALVMVFALAVTAFATETGTTTTGTITVANPVEGQTYTAYKIFDVVYDTNDHYSYTIDNTSEWFGTVSAYATEAHGLTLTEVFGTTPTTYVVTTGNGFSAPDFAAALKAALDADATTFTGKELTKSGTSEKASATVNELGYYFVTSTTGALCNLTTTNPNVNIHDKTNMPFKKEVDKTNVDVGQTVKFTITGNVPDYTGFKEYIYKITDKMTAGLTFNRDSLTVKVGEATVTNDCTIAYDATNAPQTFTVSIPVLTKKYTFGAKIEVTYTATVNEKAIAVVSENKAELTYSNDSTDSESKTTTPPEIVKVYTSKIVIDKYETDKPRTKLPGAEFVLCREAPNVHVAAVQYAAAQNAAQYDIQYYKWDETTKAVSWVDNIAKATKVTTDNKGEAFFEGLADGTYRLVETKAPAGYNRMTEAQKVVVNGGTALSVTAKVENQAGTLLPSTGGVGTTVFYVLGAVLVLGAVVLLVTKKRMNDANR